MRGRPPLGWRLDGSLSEVVEVNEQAEAGAHLVSLGQVRPALLVNVAGGEVVSEVAALDVCEDRLGGIGFAL